jgi:alkanesulfonate monooxygenase SsuD/methylene tetrahydromethanopterin reductase-like flavin-dependent oxidoreductase (luciferase family)
MLGAAAAARYPRGRDVRTGERRRDDVSGERRMKVGLTSTLGEQGEPPRALGYREVQDLAQATEEVGLDSFWLDDHLLFRTAGGDERGAWEAFTFLAAVAATTRRIALGPLVACASFRNPALLAKMADSLDEISGGRFILGLGAGWHEPEYAAFGYPFDHRAARFEEALRIIVPLLREGHVDLAGTYYQAHDAVLRPRGPTPGGPPIWIGAKRPHMLRLVARYADAWNYVWPRSAEALAPALPPFEAACREEGRDPAQIALTAGTFVRLLAPGERRPADAPSIIGEPEEVAHMLRGFADAGVRHLQVGVQPPSVEGVRRLGRAVALLDQMG